MRRVWPVAVAVVLVACSKPPAPKPPPANLPAHTVADIAGRWVTSDDLDNGYTMTIEPSGTIDVWIDRGKAGRCEQKGTIEPRHGRVFRVTYTRGECNPEVVNLPFDMMIEEITAERMTIVVQDQPRTYQRAPVDDGVKAERGPPAQLQ